MQGGGVFFLTNFFAGNENMVKCAILQILYKMKDVISYY